MKLEHLQNLKVIFPEAAFFTSFESAADPVSVQTTKCGDGSDTDSCDEDDTNCIPKPLISLFDPVVINIDVATVKEKFFTTVNDNNNENLI